MSACIHACKHACIYVCIINNEFESSISLRLYYCINYYTNIILISIILISTITEYFNTWLYKARRWSDRTKNKEA